MLKLGITSGLSGLAWKAGIAAYRDRVSSIAAGVAFFVLLAVFPGIALIVALYSVFADPGRGGALLEALPAVLPEQAVEIIARQTEHIAEQQNGSGSRFAFMPVLGLTVLLWSANRGLSSLFAALSVINDKQDSRSFLERSAISLLFTIGLIVFVLLVVSFIFVLPAFFKALGLGELLSMVLTLLRWPALLFIVGFALALIYRFGSPHENSQWRSVSLGSAVASILWVSTSIVFEWTVTAFGSFSQLYGSLSAMIGFMTWIWISIVLVLFGAEINAEAQRRGGLTSRPPPTGMNLDRTSVRADESDGS